MTDDWVKIFGPPGTGKTTTLKNIFAHVTGMYNAENALAKLGLEIPYDIAPKSEVVFVSFSNTAVDEFLGRIGLRRDYKLGFWSTMHGISMSLLIRAGILKKEVVSRMLLGGGVVRWQKKFCIENNIPFDETGELNLLGNQFFNALTYVINKFYPEVQDLNRVIDMLYDFDERFPYMAERWYRFKSKNGILDFNDVLMLEFKYELKPPGTVIIADEFQDFSRLQYEIFMMWAQDKDYAYVVGDDDQAIMQHNGAEAKYLLEFPGEPVVLKKSWRLPNNLVWLARKYIETYVKNRQPKEFYGQDKKGFFMVKSGVGINGVVRYAYTLARKGYDVLVLMRTNAEVKKIEEYFIRYAIPYYRFKRYTFWEEFVEPMVAVVNSIRRGKLPDPNDLRKYLKLMGMSEAAIDKLLEGLNENNKLYMHVVLKYLNKDPAEILKPGYVSEVVGGVERARLIIDILHRAYIGKWERPRGKIFVETIHSSKGREADFVIMVDSITQKIVDEISMGGFEDEARVWYVAMTRARIGEIVIPGDMPFLTPKVGRWVNYVN